MIKKKTTKESVQNAVKEVVNEDIVKKFNLNPHLFKPVHRIRVYVYIFLAFTIGVGSSFLFVIHESRYYICTQIKQPSFLFNNKMLNKSSELSVKNILDIKFKSEVDSSITKYVSNTKGFNNSSYVPKNLEIIAGDYVIDVKGNSKLRTEANRALQLMAADFCKEFGERLTVVSAYRSFEYQSLLKSMGCNDSYCAKPGYSEHQTGLAVDLWEASTEVDFLSKKNYLKYFEWMNENAHNYGFHNTYQKGIEVDGYVVEPWHWRYVGLDLAKTLYENELTLSEYYKNLK
ncbi:hypothetical protein EOM39_06120 [Candidatus Gracilibacteria bacterium]|nr:hypothetical protein [Candidatus Gracilibacteria bacterium]